MAEKICIVTDSCADIPNRYLEEYDIRMIPILIQTSTKTYKDRVDITSRDVYKMLDTEVFKTASPTGEDILTKLEEVKADGYTHVVAIMLSSGLSGTYNSLRLWKDNIDGLEVEVFDSLNGAIGCGMMCIQAARYVQQGMSFEELKGKVQGLIKNTFVFFSLEHLDLLERGGRIGKASSLLGTVMKIHPILSFYSDGELFNVAKVRGKAKLAQKLVSLVKKKEEEHPNCKYNIMIADGDNKEGLEEVRSKMLETFPIHVDFVEAEIGATLSCYIGNDILGAGIQFLED